MIKFLRYLCRIFRLPFLLTITYEVDMNIVPGTLKVRLNKKELKLGKDYICNNNRSITFL